jgi:hypothetical protein
VEADLLIAGEVYRQIELALAVAATREQELRDALSEQTVHVRKLTEERDRLEEAAAK